ncbi:MAG: HipA N-terminal domain-containing protein [Bacteroidota bacterium]
MRKAEVYRNGILAGILSEESRKSYLFRYTDAYFYDAGQPAVSLTLPKTQQEFRSELMFSFFCNMIAEGANLAIQCRYLKIDERDILGLLAATAAIDTIGAVTVKMLQEK